MKDRNNADLLLEVLCACVKDMKQKKFLQSFREAASWIDRNRDTICKNISCMTESMAKSIDRTPAEPSQVKRRRFQTFKRINHEKWSFPTVDEKGDICVNSEVVVVLWNDWTGGQLSVIGKQCSQLWGIGKGGAQHRLPCDFPVKSGSQIYFIKVGICLLLCSEKLCCVPDFGDFLFRKAQFWGRQVCICRGGKICICGTVDKSCSFWSTFVVMIMPAKKKSSLLWAVFIFEIHVS